MKLVLWEQILPEVARVTYSSLAIPDVERDSLNRDIAEIILPAELVIDVEWCEDDKAYVVTLYRGEYENMIVQNNAETASEVVELVKQLAEAYQDENVPVWSASNYADTEFFTTDKPLEYA